MDLSDPQMMLVIPEELVVRCADAIISMYGAEADNTFSRVLAQGIEYKEAGLTPIYLSSQDMQKVSITTLEKIHNRYH